METEKFNYNLPKEKIALYPPAQRGNSRLLVVNRDNGDIEHKKYTDIHQYLGIDDVVVINNTKVENSRLIFKSESLREHEVLILPTVSKDELEALISSSKKLEKGQVLELVDDPSFKVLLTERVSKEPVWKIRWIEGSSEKAFDRYGHVPLPPYIDRDDTDADKTRYNTSFAQNPGSSASPTASLNLTADLIERIKQKGVNIAEVTLHVGWGTFAPIRSDSIEEHEIHKEWYEISQDATDKINSSIRSGGKVWAFGTTSTRVLESSFSNGKVRSNRGVTDLYIYPGYEWQVVDTLTTNFHAPKTSLLTLVSSFMGYNLMMKAYKSALDNDYKFLSYGDSMLIL